MKQVVVYRGRTTTVTVGLGYDVSGDVIRSQIRAGKDEESELLAEWVVSFATDGTDGELILRLDNSLTTNIDKDIGYMDLLRVTGGEPVPVFDEPLEVIFKNGITV